MDLMMINEAYCSFEVAKLLKEKGFDELCYRIYYYKPYDNNSVALSDVSKARQDNSTDLHNCKICACPTHQMALAYLREKGIYIMIDKDFCNIDGWHYYIATKEKWSGKEVEHIQQESNHYTYEEVVEAALKCALENLI